MNRKTIFHLSDKQKSTQNFMQLLAVMLFLFLPVAGISQPAKLTGTAPGAEGRSVHLYVTKDFITNLEEEKVVTRIDTSGKFSLSLDIQQTVYARLSIDFHSVSMFIEPGKSYQLEIAPMSYNSSVEINPFIQSENLQVDFRNEDPDELNALVQQFNVLNSNFLLKHFNDLYHDRNIALLDTFKLEIVTSFLTTQNPYFAYYVKYKIASLEQVAKALPQAQLAKKYFCDPPVMVGNIEYMNFFNQFFTKYITATSRSLKFIDYPSILKGPSSYTALMKALEADTLLKKPQLRELVMLKNLDEMYNMPSYNRDDILALLRTVSEQGKYPENRLIAQDIIELVTHLKPGSPAPPFALYDRNRKLVKLSDLKGKPVLLGFWTTYCHGCLSEMELVKALYSKYGNRMNFVSICADREFMKMSFFLDMKKDFGWKFLHIGDQLELLKEYDVRSYPLFVLIDGSGNIWNSQAEMPSAGLESSIEKLLNP
jgi:thiol-disulfide isomerase/thioredoxin